MDYILCISKCSESKVLTHTYLFAQNNRLKFSLFHFVDVSMNVSTEDIQTHDWFNSVRLNIQTQSKPWRQLRNKVLGQVLLWVQDKTYPKDLSQLSVKDKKALLEKIEDFVAQEQSLKVAQADVLARLGSFVGAAVKTKYPRFDEVSRWDQVQIDKLYKSETEHAICQILQSRPELTTDLCSHINVQFSNNVRRLAYWILLGKDQACTSECDLSFSDE